MKLFFGIIIAVLIVGALLGAFLRGSLFPEAYDPYRNLEEAPPAAVAPQDAVLVSPSELGFIVAALEHSALTRNAHEYLASVTASDDPLRTLTDSITPTHDSAYAELAGWYEEALGMAFVDTTKDNPFLASLTGYALLDLRAAFLESIIISHLTFLESYGGFAEETTQPELASLATMFEELLLLEVEIYEEALTPLNE